MAEFLGFISIDPWHLLFTWINLFLLILMLKKFLFKPVTKIMAERKAEVDKLYSDAETARTGAEQDKKEYGEKLSHAVDEADGIVKAATERAGRKSEAMLTETSEQIAQMKEKAQADIEQERAKARNELKNDISGMVLDIAGKVIGREMTGGDQEALIDRFIDEVGDETPAGENHD